LNRDEHLIVRMHARTLAGAPDKTMYSNTSLRIQISDVNAAYLHTSNGTFTIMSAYTIALTISFAHIIMYV
jgi:hypothetical protein